MPPFQYRKRFENRVIRALLPPDREHGADMDDPIMSDDDDDSIHSVTSNAVSSTAYVTIFGNLQDGYSRCGTRADS